MGLRINQEAFASTLEKIILLSLKRGPASLEQLRKDVASAGVPVTIPEVAVIARRLVGNEYAEGARQWVIRFDNGCYFRQETRVSTFSRFVELPEYPARENIHKFLKGVWRLEPLRRAPVV